MWSKRRNLLLVMVWDREAGNQRCVGLQYWSYDGCKICGGSSEWPTCQTHQMRSQMYYVVDHVSHPYSKTGTIHTSDKDATWYSAWCYAMLMRHYIPCLAYWLLGIVTTRAWQIVYTQRGCEGKRGPGGNFSFYKLINFEMTKWKKEIFIRQRKVRDRKLTL